MDKTTSDLIDIESVQKIRPKPNEQNFGQLNDYRLQISQKFSKCEQKLSEALLQTAQLAQPSPSILQSNDRIRKVKEILKSSAQYDVSIADMRAYLRVIEKSIQKMRDFDVTEFVVSAASALPSATPNLIQ
ncbi:hypothetical protein HK096_007941 [Nowakowskiella sp. JEL0078]|nr:hypothetical protein HK096_007941 [Nowakowskiella sp. JEL0078]